MPKGTICITIGLLCLISALALTGYNRIEADRAGEDAQQIMEELSQIIPEKAPIQAPQPTLPTESPSEPVEDTPSPDPPTLPEPEPELPAYIQNPQMEMPVQNLQGYDYIGILRIPSLSLELPIMSQWSYKQLKIAPCRYTGSVYQDNMTICAHNYAKHFGGLKNLHIGDEVSFTDMDGNEFAYRVTELETLQPSDVDSMTAGDWDLTLFTCTIGGKNRVTVRCERIS